MSRPTREPPAVSVMLAKVREDLYPLPRFALNAEVRTEVGANLPELRTADAIVADTQAGDGWRLIVLEAKRSRKDTADELAHLAKSLPHDRICGERLLVVPAPWVRYVLTLLELPPGVGLIEVGLRAVEILPAARRRVAEPPIGFLKALLRSAAFAAERLERDDTAPPGAPMVPIVRYLSRSHVALACGHAAPMPLTKRIPARVPCFACAEDRPVDRDVVLAALADAPPEDLAAYLEAIDERAARVGPPERAAAEGGRR